MKSITIHNFQTTIPAQLYRRGKQGLAAGSLIYVTESPDNHFEALVTNFGTNYRIKIIFKEQEISYMSCNCQDQGRMCHHLVTVLLELKETVERFKNPINTADKKGTLDAKKEVTQEKEAVVEIKSASDFSESIKLYLKLAPIEQAIIKLLAISWEAYSVSKLVKTINKISLQEYHQKVKSDNITLIVQKLVQSKLIYNEKSSSYRCQNDFSDEICDHFFANDPDFKSIADYLIKNKYDSSRFWSYYNSSDTNYFRDMRIARYTNNFKDFSTYYFNLVNYKHHYEYDSQEKICDYWLTKSFNLKKLESFSIPIRSFLLVQKLTLQIFDLKPTDQYFDYTVKNINKLATNQIGTLLSLISKIYLFQGNWEKLKENYKHPKFPVENIGIYTAILQFITGHSEAALKNFEASLKVLRQKLNDRTIRLHNLEGFFHILTKIKISNQRPIKKIDSHIDWTIKNHSSYDALFYWLKALRSFFKNNKKEALSLMQMKTAHYPLVNLFKPFFYYWIDDKKINKQNLIQSHNLVEKNGYKWLATELLALRNAIEPNTERTNKLQENLSLLGIEPLIKASPKVEDWEIAINVLQKLGINSAPAKNAENRLAWLVDFTNHRLKAKGQTKGKNGWTKGRAITFQRLESGEIEYLTPQDQRIINAIDHAYSSEISIRSAEVWKQLVGHPLLFLYKSPGVAVKFRTLKPRLIARKEKEGFRLSLSHPVNNKGFHLVKESPTRYNLVEVNERIAQIAKAFNDKSLYVPAVGTSALKEAISGLSNVIEVESAFEEDNLPSVTSDSRACVHLLPVGDGFHVEIYAKPFNTVPPYVKIGQGEPTLITTLDGVRTVTNRDLKVEKQNLKKLRSSIEILKNTRPFNGVWELDDTEGCLELLTGLSPFIEEESIILEWPKGEKFKVSKIIGFDQFSMQIKEKNNWFELDGSIKVDEDRILSMQELLQLSQGKSQFIELSRGKFLALTKEFRNRLEAINGLVNPQKNGTLQLHPLAAPAMQEFTDAVTHLEADKKFKESQEKLRKAYAKKFKVSKKFQAELRPYQKEGFQWLHRCAAWGVGACLADDMGLGKTVQALALLTDRAKLGPALVMAPASVCRNWMAETRKFAPTLTPILFGEGDRKTTVEKAKKGDLLVATYDLVTRESALFAEKNFATLILDEAQAIKNRATKRSETAMSLQADFKIIMTGTPVENHLGELWNLFQFANPGLLGSLDNFNKRFSIPIEKNKDQNRREQLRKLLQPFILRRKKGEVLKDLPEKTEITLTATLSPDERAFYEALRRNALSKLTNDDSHGGQKHLKILAEIMRLRRAACHPQLVDANTTLIESSKLQLFSEVVAELLANNHKALVFSQFVGHLKILENHLKKQNIAYQYLDGQTPLAKRQDRIEAFQAGEGDIFLISLKAGGTGLNLTAADFVIHMDPWWNPAVEDQATDRAHRIGQERPVTVYRLVAADTIEEKILQLHDKKRDLADSLLSGTDISAKLTAKDLLNLISESR